LKGPVSTCRFSDVVIRTTDEKEWSALDGEVLQWPPTPADLQPWVIPDDEREARQYEQTVYQGQEPTYEKVAVFYPPIKYPNAIVGADGYPGKVYVAWNGAVVLPAVNENFYFGLLSLKAAYRADSGEIHCSIHLPSRSPAVQTMLRLRHPTSAALKSVTIDGKPWTDFDASRERIRLPQTSQEILVTASYD
jgi:hypothetical protein